MERKMMSRKTLEEIYAREVQAANLKARKLPSREESESTPQTPRERKTMDCPQSESPYAFHDTRVMSLVGWEDVTIQQLLPVQGWRIAYCVHGSHILYPVPLL